MFLQAACTGYFDDSNVVTERAWTNPYQNYDNVGKAILSLFIAVTLNGYSRKPPPSIPELLHQLGCHMWHASKPLVQHC